MSENQENQVVIAEKRTEENMAGVNAFIEQNSAVVIVDQESFDAVDATTRDVKKRITALKDEYKGIVKPLNEAKDKITALFKKPIEAYENFFNGQKKKSSDYLLEKERERRENQRKVDEAAAKERARLEKLADKQEAKGKTDSADMTRSIADTIVSPLVQPSVQKGGTYNVEKHTVIITDPAVLLKWILDNNHLEYITFNQSLFNKEAQSTKGRRTWPGTKNDKKFEPRYR